MTTALDRPLTRIAYTIEDAAAEVGLSPRYIREEIYTGRLKAKAAGTKLIVRRADLEEWVDALPDR